MGKYLPASNFSLDAITFLSNLFFKNIGYTLDCVLTKLILCKSIPTIKESFPL